MQGPYILTEAPKSWLICPEKQFLLYHIYIWTCFNYLLRKIPFFFVTLCRTLKVICTLPLLQCPRLIKKKLHFFLGFPDKPHSLSASCSESSAVFSWISPNNGGNNQTFSTTYGYFNPPVIKDRTGIPDPGENLTVTVTIQLEKIVHTFFFTVKTVNQFGYTEADDIVNCTTGTADIFTWYNETCSENEIPQDQQTCLLKMSSVLLKILFSLVAQIEENFKIWDYNMMCLKAF